MTRDEILNTSKEQINELVCELMESKPVGQTISELRKNYFDWRYSTFSATSPDEWWKAEIGTDINLVNGQFDAKYDNYLANWKPNKFPAYSIADAWKVFESMLEECRDRDGEPDFLMLNAYPSGRFYCAKLWAHHDGDIASVEVDEETAPLAISRTKALLAVMDGER